MRRCVLFLVSALAVAASGVELRGIQVCEGCPVKKLKTTRISDGKWQTKIVLGAGVTVQDAELIVGAVRRKTLSDIDDPAAQGWPAIDAQKLTQINQSEWIAVIEDPPWSFVRRPGAQYFDVIERSGRIHVIGRIAGRLERVASTIVDP